MNTTARIGLLAILGAAAALAAGCVQARAPGSVAALTIFGSRYAVAGVASNQALTIEGGASPSTSATIPLK
jgi:hypothetical protein